MSRSVLRLASDQGKWMTISLVAEFRQTLNLIATVVDTNALNPDKVSPFCWSQMDWEEPYPSAWSPNEADRKFVSVITVATNHSLKQVRCEVHNGEIPVRFC